MKKGILLVNLGSPKSTNVEDVREYLDEFLMDEKVIDYRYFFRYLLVKGIILKRRPQKSAEAYRSVWTKEGSPLIVITEKLQKKLQKIVDIPVEIGMRYAQPSIESGIQKLVDMGVTDIILLPLYPQYAMSTTETVIAKAEEVRKAKFPNINIKFVGAFYNNSDYIHSLAKSISGHLPTEFDAILFSYHGVPERHLPKVDRNITKLVKNWATDNGKPLFDIDYQQQCLRTTELVRDKLGLPKEKVFTSFQSRLGKDKWIEPYTDATLEALPKKGIKKLAVCCPAFVSDCLETLEEIAMEGKDEFLHAGGESFHYLPCLNDDDIFVNVVKNLCEV